MRLLSGLLAVFIGMVVFTGCAHAAGLNITQFHDPSMFLQNVKTFLEQTLKNDLSKALGNSTDIRNVKGYTSWAYALMIGAWAIKLSEVTGRAAVFGDPYSEIVGVIITAIVAQLLFSSYGKWAPDLVNAGSSLGDLVQNKILRNEDRMFPYDYILRLGGMIQVSSLTFNQQQVGEFLYTAVLVLSLCLLYAAGLFACMWPALVGGIAVLLGPLTFMFVFHKSLSWIFDGWLRLMFWTTIFAFVSRIAMVMNCLFFGSILNISTVARPVGGLVIVDDTYQYAFACLISMVVVSLALLFFSGILASIVTGSSRLDASDMIKSASQKAGRALLSLF